MSVEQPQHKKKSLWLRLQKPYRLAFVNQETLQEERVWAVSPLKLLGAFFALCALVFLFILLVMRFTPLGGWLGFGAGSSSKARNLGDDELRATLEELFVQVDSMTVQLAVRDQYIATLQSTILGKKIDAPIDSGLLASIQPRDSSILKGKGQVAEKTQATQNVIATAQQELELHDLVSETFLEDARIDDISIVSPLQGVASVSDTFAPLRGHYGIDLLAPSGSHIKAVKSGTVILATWSADTGYLLAVQHSNQLVSFYKHNSKLLKKTGDLVKTGEAIAIIGNTGEMTDGPHLHFELWFNGQPVDPQRYISFNTK